VDYVNYNLIVLAMLVAALILILLVLNRRSRFVYEMMTLAKKAQQRQLKKKSPSSSQSPSPEQLKLEMERDLAEVPTPWGWPNYEKYESLHHWAGRMVQEKHTVDDEEYRHRKEVCLRTLVEDRYGRSAMMNPKTYARLAKNSTGPDIQDQKQLDKISHGGSNNIEITGEIYHYSKLKYTQRL